MSSSCSKIYLIDESPYGYALRKVYSNEDIDPITWNLENLAIKLKLKKKKNVKITAKY